MMFQVFTMPSLCWLAFFDRKLTIILTAWINNYVAVSAEIHTCYQCCLESSFMHALNWVLKHPLLCSIFDYELLRFWTQQRCPRPDIQRIFSRTREKVRTNGLFGTNFRKICWQNRLIFIILCRSLFVCGTICYFPMFMKFILVT